MTGLMVVKRGEVYDARLDPTEGSEQAGRRPVVIVSRDVINRTSPVVIAVPCTTYRAGRHIYPTQVLLYAPDGGLTADSVVLGEQMRSLDKQRLLARRGVLSSQALAQIERALAITLDIRLRP